jgi:hypothetical protein
MRSKPIKDQDPGRVVDSGRDKKASFESGRGYNAVTRVAIESRGRRSEGSRELVLLQIRAFVPRDGSCVTILEGREENTIGAHNRIKAVNEHDMVLTKR